MNERLDLYLDGMLHGPELAEFEALLASRPDLQAQVALQRQIDGSVRAALPYHPAPPISFPVSAQAAPPAAPIAGRIGPSIAPPKTNWRRLAIAASLLLGGAGIWAGYVHLSTPTFDRLIAPDALYAQLSAGGFKPEFICIDDAGFAKAVKDRLGSALHMTPAPAVVALGWAYGDAYNGKLIGDNTLVLMATVDSQNVVVLLDRSCNDRALNIPADSGLFLHRATSGDLVMYEVTPLAQPRVLPLLHP